MSNYRSNTPDYMRRPDNYGCSRENISDSRSGCGCSRENVTDLRGGCQAPVKPCQQPCEAEQKSRCSEFNSYCKQVYKKDDCLSKFALAMAYVPWQDWNCPYAVEKGLQCGTIFKELDKPFRGIGGCNR